MSKIFEEQKIRDACKILKSRGFFARANQLPDKEKWQIVITDSKLNREDQFALECKLLTEFDMSIVCLS